MDERSIVMNDCNRLTVPFSEVPRETSFYDVNNRESRKSAKKKLFSKAQMKSFA